MVEKNRKSRRLTEILVLLFVIVGVFLVLSELRTNVSSELGGRMSQGVPNPD